MDAAVRRRVGLWVRIGLTAAALTYLYFSEDWGEVGRRLGQVRVSTAALWSLLFAVPLVGTTARWGLVLNAAGMRPSPWQLFRLMYAGMFFSLFLPGGAGGDAVRAVLAARDTQRKGAAVASIVVDRAIGILTMIAIGLGACLLNRDREGMGEPAVVLGAMLACALGGVAALLIPALRRLAPVRWAFSRVPAIADADALVLSLRGRPGVLLAGVAITAVGQVATLLVLCGLASALDLPVTRTDLFAVGPLIFTANSLPISIGGWGVGEKASDYLLGRIGLAAGSGTALFLLYRLCVIGFALPGALVFAAGRLRPGFRSPSAEPAP